MAKTSPEIDAQLPTFQALEQTRGRTIDDFRIVTIPGDNDCHQFERLTFYFTDGNTLSIDVGSNALNLSLSVKGLAASDFHTDLFAKFDSASDETRVLTASENAL